jgi:hypothetical protein
MSIEGHAVAREAPELAQSLVDAFVENPISDEHRYLHLSEAATTRYETKARLYRTAILLMTLGAEEQNERALTHVREHVERIVLPRAPDYLLLAELRNAMRDVSKLLEEKNDGKVIGWANAWLQDIEIDESNPAALVLLATQWMDGYLAVVRTIEELKVLIAGGELPNPAAKSVASSQDRPLGYTMDSVKLPKPETQASPDPKKFSVTSSKLGDTEVRDAQGKLRMYISAGAPIAGSQTEPAHPERPTMSTSTQQEDPVLTPESNPEEWSKHTDMASEILKLRLSEAAKLKPKIFPFPKKPKPPTPRS